MSGAFQAPINVYGAFTGQKKERPPPEAAQSPRMLKVRGPFRLAPIHMDKGGSRAHCTPAGWGAAHGQCVPIAAAEVRNQDPIPRPA